MSYRHIALRCVLIFAVAWLLTVVVPTVFAGTIVIDDFESPRPEGEVHFLPKSTDPTTSLLVKHTDTDDHILGGERDMLIKVLGPSGPLSAAAIIGQEPEVHKAGVLQIATCGKSPTEVRLQYNGTDDPDWGDPILEKLNSAKSLSVDLTDGGTNDRFVLRFISSDGVHPKGLKIGVQVTGTDQHEAAVTLKYWGYVADSKRKFEIKFTEFEPQGSAVFGNVNSLMFLFNTDAAGLSMPNVDFVIDGIDVVPEPSVLVLLGCMVVGFAVYGYRRRRRR